jgi:hypothetical protein
LPASNTIPRISILLFLLFTFLYILVLRQSSGQIIKTGVGRNNVQ